MEEVETAGVETNTPEETTVTTETEVTETTTVQDQEQTAEDVETKEETTPEIEQEKPEKEEEKEAELSDEEQMRQREADIEKREKALQEKELQNAAKAKFQELNLPEELLPYSIQQDEVSTMEYIGKFKEAFDAAVEVALNAKMNGRTPRVTSGTVTAGDKTDADVFAAALRG